MLPPRKKEFAFRNTAGVNPRPTVGALFRRWSRTKLAEGELAQVCLDGSMPSICYANTAKLGRTAEDVGPYKPSPAGEGGRRSLTDEVSRREIHCRSRTTGCRGRLSCCGARKNLRACAFLDFFDRCNVCQRQTCSARRSRGQATSLALPFSATGSGRARPLRVCVSS